MNEQTLQFGPNNALVGTLASTDNPPAGIGALLFNAGVVPRIGPNRLNVRIAAGSVSIVCRWLSNL